jgi:hypothetical protein
VLAIHYSDCNQVLYIAALQGIIKISYESIIGIVSNIGLQKISAHWTLKSNPLTNNLEISCGENKEQIGFNSWLIPFTNVYGAILFNYQNDVIAGVYSTTGCISIVSSSKPEYKTQSLYLKMTFNKAIYIDTPEASYILIKEIPPSSATIYQYTRVLFKSNKYQFDYYAPIEYEFIQNFYDYIDVTLIEFDTGKPSLLCLSKKSLDIYDPQYLKSPFVTVNLSFKPNHLYYPTKRFLFSISETEVTMSIWPHNQVFPKSKLLNYYYESQYTYTPKYLKQTNIFIKQADNTQLHQVIGSINDGVICLNIASSRGINQCKVGLPEDVGLLLHRSISEIHNFRKMLIFLQLMGGNTNSLLIKMSNIYKQHQYELNFEVACLAYYSDPYLIIEHFLKYEEINVKMLNYILQKITIDQMDATKLVPVFIYIILRHYSIRVSIEQITAAMETIDVF